MNYATVIFKVYWQFKDYPYLKITKDKKIIDTRTQRLLKYHPRGYFINGRYYKKSEINNMAEKIKKSKCPF